MDFFCCALLGTLYLGPYNIPYMNYTTFTIYHSRVFKNMFKFISQISV